MLQQQPQTVFSEKQKQTNKKKKKTEPTTFHGSRVSFQSWEVGWCDPVILKLDYFHNIWSDMHSKLCFQVRIVIFPPPQKKTLMKIARFYDIYVKIKFYQYFTHTHTPPHTPSITLVYGTSEWWVKTRKRPVNVTSNHGACRTAVWSNTTCLTKSWNIYIIITRFQT